MAAGMRVGGSKSLRIRIILRQADYIVPIYVHLADSTAKSTSRVRPGISAHAVGEFRQSAVSARESGSPGTGLARGSGEYRT